MNLFIIVLAGILYPFQRTANLPLDTTTTVTLYLQNENEWATGNITIHYWETISAYKKSMQSPHKSITQLPQNGRTTFTIPTTKHPTYFKIENHYMEGVPLKWLISKGDKIYITITDTGMEFDGKGAEKLRCLQQMSKKYLLERNEINSNSSTSTVRKTATDRVNEILKTFKINLKSNLNTLLPYRDSMQSNEYVIIKANILGKYYLDAMRAFTMTYDQPQKQERLNIKAIFQKEMQVLQGKDMQADSVLLLSDEFCGALVASRFVQKRMGLSENVFTDLKKNYNANVRDKLITILLNDHHHGMEDLDSLLTDALSFVSDSYMRNQLKELQQGLSHNIEVPDLKFWDTLGHERSLSEFRGKVVFIDFWFTGCVPCIFFYKNVVIETEESFRKNDSIVFLSINMDKQKQSWLKSIASGEYTSPQIHNFYIGPATYDNPWATHFRIKSVPHPLVIDKHGRIFNARSSDLRNSQQLPLILNRALKVQE